MGYIDISATYLDMVNSVPGPYKGTFMWSRYGGDTEETRPGYGSDPFRYKRKRD